MLRRTTFRLGKMDCPSEEQLVRMALDGSREVRSLRFDPQGRTLEVVHSGAFDAIAQRLDVLDLDSSVIASAEVDIDGPGEDSAAQRRLLWQVLLINAAFFLLEIVAGFAAESMGLVADSLDMLADSLVYGLSLIAVGRAASHKRGVAAVSGVFQLTLAIAGLVEVVRRFVTPQDLPSFRVMVVVSLLALLGNAACLYLLRRSGSSDAHMQASMIFTSNDVLANLGVIVAGLLVLTTQSKIPDLAIGIAIFILVGRGALRILQLARVPAAK